MGEEKSVKYAHKIRVRKKRANERTITLTLVRIRDENEEPRVHTHLCIMDVDTNAGQIGHWSITPLRKTRYSHRISRLVNFVAKLLGIRIRVQSVLPCLRIFQ